MTFQVNPPPSSHIPEKISPLKFAGRAHAQIFGFQVPSGTAFFWLDCV
jgi:hypothetical protein